MAFSMIADIYSTGYSGSEIQVLYAPCHHLGNKRIFFLWLTWHSCWMPCFSVHIQPGGPPWVLWAWGPSGYGLYGCNCCEFLMPHLLPLLMQIRYNLHYRIIHRGSIRRLTSTATPTLMSTMDMSFSWMEFVSGLQIDTTLLWPIFTARFHEWYSTVKALDYCIITTKCSVMHHNEKSPHPKCFSFEFSDSFWIFFNWKFLNLWTLGRNDTVY